MDFYSFQSAGRQGQRSGEKENILHNINLYHGTMEFPLALASLSGAENLSFTLQAVFSSALVSTLHRDNTRAPTQALGFGWSMEMPRIRVLDSQAARNLQAEFSLVSEGGAFPLSRAGEENGTVRFISVHHPAWDFRYCPANGGYWDVWKEDGSRWRFGGAGNSTEVRLAWDNWVGAAAANGAQPFSVGWYLCEIEGAYGSRIQIAYENQKEQVGNSAYTRNMRLKQVTTAYGESITLHYGKKEAWEYGGEGDAAPLRAYQYAWDDGYLQSIDVTTDEGTPLYRQELAYSFFSINGKESYRKRFLQSVTQVASDGRKMPPISFRYSFDKDAALPGALIGVTQPAGAKMAFDYEKMAWENAGGDTAIQPPAAGWECQMFHADSYSVAKFTCGRQVRLKAFYWDMGWREWEDSSFSGEEISDMVLLTGENFFAAVFFSVQRGQYCARMFRRSQTRRAEWGVYPIERALGRSLPAAACGPDFLALQAQGGQALILCQYDFLADCWRIQELASDAADFTVLGAGRDFLLAAYYRESAGLLRLRSFYADAGHTWRAGDIRDQSEALEWRLMSPFSVWSLGDSQAGAAFVWIQNETTVRGTIALLRWREDYTFSDVALHRVEQSEKVKNPLLYAAVSGSMTGYAQMVFRYVPGQWREYRLLTPQNGGEYAYAYGGDIALAVERIGDTQRFYAIRFDPLRMDWTPEGAPQSGAIHGEALCPPHIAGSYAVLGRTLFHCARAHKWTALYTFPENARLDSICLDPAGGYALYAVKGQDTTVKLALDGESVQEEQRLEGQLCTGAAGGFAGLSAFHTSRRDAGLQLYALRENRCFRRAEAAVVRDVSLDPGDGAQRYVLRYESAGARMEAFVPAFQRVQAIPVEEAAPYGAVRYTYFNGLPEDDPSAAYPPDDAYSNARACYSRFAGWLFQTEVFRAGNILEKSSTTYTRALDGQGYILRPMRVVEREYLPVYDLAARKACGKTACRESIITNSYESRYYQLRRTEKSGWNAQGKGTSLAIEHLYAWETCAAAAKAHLLDPIAYTRQYDTATQTTISAQAVHWAADQERKWHEAAWLMWNGEGGGAYPKTETAAGWDVTKRAISWGSAGAETEILLEGGKPESVLYDKAGKAVVARFSRALLQQAAYCGFEPYETLGRWKLSGGTWDACIETAECYSGSRCLRLGGGQSLTAKLTGCDGGTPVLLHAAVKGAGGMFRLTVRHGAREKQMESALPTSEYWTPCAIQMELPEEFRRSGQTVDVEACLTGPCAKSILLDAVFLTPLSCEASATVYAGPHKLQCASHSNRGAGLLNFYDPCGRPTGTAAEDGGIRTLSRQLYTAPGRQGRADAKDCTAAVEFAQRGDICPMHRGSDWQRQWAAEGGWKIQGQRLTAENGPAVLRYEQELSAQYALYMALESGAGTWEVHTGQAAIHMQKGKGAVREKGRTLAEFSLTDCELAQDFLLLRMGSRMALYAWDKELFCIGGLEETPAGLSLTAQKAALRCLGVGASPRVRLSYTDHAGTPLQDQIVTDSGVIVSQSLYSPMRRIEVRTKPAEIPSALWGWRPSLVTGWDEKSGVLSGEAARIFPEDEGYPYERSVVTKSPSPVVAEIGRPGKAFAIRAGATDSRTATFARYIPTNLPAAVPEKGLYMKCQQDPDGKNNITVYDSFDRQVWTITDAPDGERQAIHTLYDVQGRVCETRIAAGGAKGTERRVQAMAYDAAGHLASQANPDIGTSRFIYDTRGRLHYEQNAAGAGEGWYIYHVYDAQDRETETGRISGAWNEAALRKKAQAGGGRPENAQYSRRFWYDGNIGQYQTGKLWKCETRADQGVVCETFSYDARGNITEKKQSIDGCEDVVTFTYDGRNALLSQTVNGREETSVRYAYDAAGRLKTVWAAGRPVAENTYDAAGNLTAETFAPGTGAPLTRTYTYNSAAWLTKIEDGCFSQSIDYDPASGRIRQMQVRIQDARFAVPVLNTSCAYDGFGRLKSISHRQASQYNLGTKAPFVYDDSSNALSVDGTTYQYSGQTNRLLAAGGTQWTYSVQGACTAITDGDGEVQFTYDPVLNVVTGMQSGAGAQFFAQGTAGIAACWQAKGVTRYLTDSRGRLLCAIGPDGVTCLCVYGANGLLAQVRGGRVYYMLKDYQSSVRAVWDGKKLCGAWHYAPYGGVMDGSFSSKEIQSLLPFRFAGMLEMLPGLYRTAARWYCAASGRFLSIDPEGQYVSPYLYGGCDWVNYCDPDGAFSFGNFFAALGTFIVGAAALVAGVAISVASGGTAAPLLAVLGGAALAGFGFGAGAYGAVSMFTNEYDIYECLISGASGAVTGALLAGVGAALPAFTGWTAVLVDTAVGAVMGGGDGVVSNGLLNLCHHREFLENWQTNLIIGGVLGGVFGGLSGVGRAYRNQNLVLPKNNRANADIISVNSSHRGSHPGHSSLMKTDSAGNMTGTELFCDTPAGGGWPRTEIEVYNDTASARGRFLHESIRRAELPVAQETWQAIVPNMNFDGIRYCYLISDCTAYAVRVLGGGGFAPPLWARTPATMYLWAWLLGR